MYNVAIWLHPISKSMYIKYINNLQSDSFNYILYWFFPVPFPSVQIITSNNETIDSKRIGDSLTLNCTGTTVRGISRSLVDIIWTTGGRQVRRINNAIGDIQNDSIIYTDSFEVSSSLSTNDRGRVYQCTVLINGSFLISTSDQIILNFPGESVFRYSV